MGRTAERAIGALAIEACLKAGAVSSAPTRCEEAAIGRLVLHRAGVREPGRLLTWAAVAGVVLPPLVSAAALWLAWSQRDTYPAVDTLELLGAWGRGAAASGAASLGSLAVLALACGVRVRGTRKAGAASSAPTRARGEA